MELALHQVSMTFGQGAAAQQALAPISLSVAQGCFASIIGPSGCGKSTLFNIVAGLQQPSGGQVLVDGEDITGCIGRVGYMLQKDLLLPWRTVLDNVILGMEIRGVPAAESRAKALPLLARHGLAGFEHHYPRTLSGGMRQRVALLRTLLVDTDIILLDEPFGALDAQTKHRMQEWLLQIWADFGKTIIFVTHDVDEAIFLSDDVFVMGTRPGRIIAHLTVELERPRARSVGGLPHFIALRKHCMDLLHSLPSEQAEPREAA